MIALSGVMVMLGFWQLDRYHTRHAINTRIDQASATAPVPLSDVLSPGTSLAASREWTRVTATGQYDASKVAFARGRSMNGNVGFEILVPLVLPDGSRLLVDRGWVPVGATGPTSVPTMPPLPSGTVTVTGRLHRPESESDRPVDIQGTPSVRRIDPARLGLADSYDAYLLLDKQSPPATGFTRIPADRQPSWMNAGYTVQWWAFSVIALCGLVWAVRREANDRRLGIDRDRKAKGTARRDRPRDRLGDDPPSATASARPTPEPRQG